MQLCSADSSSWQQQNKQGGSEQICSTRVGSVGLSARSGFLIEIEEVASSAGSVSSYLPYHRSCSAH